MAETPNIQLEMSPKTAKVLAWVAWGLVLVGTVAGAVAAFAWVKQTGQQIASGVSVIALLVAAEIRRRLPSARAIRPGATVLLVALSAVAVTSCKLPPLAVAYRAYSVAVTARDGTGELIAKTCKAKVEACKAGPADKLKSCLKGCHETLSVWVRHIKPAFNTTLAAYWALLESAFVSGDKKLDKASKAAQIACEQFKAAEVAVAQYKDKLGKYVPMILGGLAGAKILVCP
jgi:hypothetical protein